MGVCGSDGGSEMSNRRPVCAPHLWEPYPPSPTPGVGGAVHFWWEHFGDLPGTASLLEPVTPVENGTLVKLNEALLPSAFQSGSKKRRQSPSLTCTVYDEVRLGNSCGCVQCPQLGQEGVHPCAVIHRVSASPGFQGRLIQFLYRR